MKSIGRLQFGWGKPEATAPEVPEAPEEISALPASEPHRQRPAGVARVNYRWALPLVTIVLLGLVYGLWSWTSGPAAAPRSHHHHSAAVPAVAPPPPPQPAAEANWEQNSPGYQSWLDVGSDMHQLGQDLNAGNTLAIMGVGGDGFKLAEAAGAALQNPSPVDRTDYKTAMGNFGLAGVAMEQGHFHIAAKFTSKALTALQAWATAAQPGASGSQLCGYWNLSAQSQNC